MALLALLLALLALGHRGAAAPSTETAQPVAAPCSGSQLAGSFRLVPGSAGAGNVVYRLALRNRSGSACAVGGVPSLVLLDRRGRPLPTRVAPAQAGRASGAGIVLAPGAAAAATARFSPDVPGPGEQVAGPCEPVAHAARVAAAGGGVALAVLEPPTRVCSHGYLSFRPLERA